MTSFPIPVATSLALFLAMLLLIECGRRVGLRFERIDAEGAHTGTGAIEGAIFALLGLLVAFTFSGAGARFDARRHLIVDEANAVGTAYLRIDSAPEQSRAPLRKLFRDYVDARLAAYAHLPDLDAALADIARGTDLQTQMWKEAVAGCSLPEAAPSCPILLLPAMNAVFDSATSHLMASKNHPPAIVFWMLYGLGLGCAVLGGYSMSHGRHRKWPHMVAFAGVFALTVYVTLDMEYPRLGLIRVDEFDAALVEVRAGMKP